MTALRLSPLRSSRALIDAAIEVHGPARVLLAAIVALLRPKARPPDAGDLPAHLRRDIGLPPEAPPAPDWTRSLH